MIGAGMRQLRTQIFTENYGARRNTRIDYTFFEYFIKIIIRSWKIGQKASITENLNDNKLIGKIKPFVFQLFI